MYDSLIRTVNDTLNKNNIKKRSINTIGLMIPGQIDFKKERAIFQNNLPWKNFEIGKKIRREFPKASFILKHDVQSAAVGEWVAKGKPNGMFLYVTISTGISASIIYQGNIILGSGLAGEIGCMKDDQGKLLEKVASGSAMEKEVRTNFPYSSLKEAFDDFNSGNNEMKGYFGEKARVIAQSLYNVFTIIDPSCLILGGGVINKQNEFYQLIISHFHELSNHPSQTGWVDRISKSKHKEMSGIYGLLK